MAVILQDVARKAGVSLTTASMAIQGRRKVALKTRRKVMDAAKELGFRPNASARSLASGRVHTLGVVIRDQHYFGLPYVSSIVSGLIEVGDREGYGLAFARSGDGSAKQEAEYIRLIRENRYEGMIILDQGAKKSEIRLISEMKIPMVLVDRRIPGLEVPTVRIDYRRVVKEATSHLISLGHRRIAILPVPEFLFEMAEKLSGYKEALKEHGIPFDQDLVKNDSQANNNVICTKEMVDELESLPKAPTAYICFQETRTPVLCDVLRYLGINIPEVSVIGCDISGLYQQGLYSIGAITVPGHELGVRVCQVLLDILQDRSATMDVVLKAKFDPKMSCAPPGR